MIDRQHDYGMDCWAGTGVWFASTNMGWITTSTVWFHSEEKWAIAFIFSGRTNGKKTALTFRLNTKFAFRNNFSNDKKYFYIITNDLHTGKQLV